jgi:hypothetical protein
MSILNQFVDLSVSLPQLGNSWRSSFCADIFEAARTVSYVETVSNKADTLHKYIFFSDERAIKKGYEKEVRFLLKRLNIRKVELAIDCKKDLYYGKKGYLNVRGIKSERGADEVWEYAVISVVHPTKLPLMAIRYPMGTDLADCCTEILEYARSLPIRIQKILFDRGFYIGHLIDYLESKKEGRPLPYLIFVPKNEAVAKYVGKTESRFGVYTHKVVYSREKSKWETQTTIVVCKNVGVNEKGEPYDWAFATNLKPSYSLVKQYRARWNIETGFRIMEEGKIKTKTNSPVIRLFYFLLRALLTVIWAINNIIRVYMTFKRYLREAERDLRRHEVNKPPIIKPLY